MNFKNPFAMNSYKTNAFAWITGIFLLLLVPASASAQQPEKMEKIKTWKVAFFTEKLDLTTEEAQKFWPVYNEYENKLEELRKKRRQERKIAKENIDEMNDKEVEALVDSEMAHRQKELDLQKEYHGKFKSVLPARKVARLYAAEEQFKLEVIKWMQKQKQQGGKGPKGPK